jgi:predicted AAA+ superfamily ATPase
MMKRFFENRLNLWLRQPKPLPMMLLGARQTGKTHLLKDFCNANFEHQVHLNFAETPDFKHFFTPSLNAADIVSRMELYFSKKIDPQKTVFFFDEIQDCEQAIASLKYFAEANWNYRIVTAGSLLGVKINRMKSSFPVGKVQIEYLFPMDFEEFLWALNEEMLAGEIRLNFNDNKPFPGIIHEKALKLYRQYLCIGGMPANVLNFIENQKDIVVFNRQISTDIITGYLADMAKYAERVNAVKIHGVFRSIPAQLAKENPKFMYHLVETGGNRDKYQTAIDWLVQANMALQTPKIETSQKPLTAYKSENCFKLYLSDVGLLTSLSQTKFNEIIQSQDWIYRGYLTENYVAQTLHAHRHLLYYWNSENRAEVDFLLDTENGVIPVEVKASDNVRSKSLRVYVEKYKPDYAIRISSRHFGFANGVKSVPLYAAHCI